MAETGVVQPRQKTRVVNLRYENYDVRIDRTTICGNPFTHLPLEKTRAEYQVATREEAIRKYEGWIKAQPQLLARLPELQGKTLGCWCKPAACHGEVLAKLADALPAGAELGFNPSVPARDSGPVGRS